MGISSKGRCAKKAQGHEVTLGDAIKVKRDGTIDRFKSRFVVCGYSQIQGVDYTQSFSATLRATSMRTLLALAAGESLSLEHFDVTSAFTQSDIDCDIYVVEPGMVKIRCSPQTGTLTPAERYGVGTFHYA